MCGKALLPREKIQEMGVESLDNEELLALVLGSGCPDCDVFQLSRNLSDYLASVNKFPTLKDLLKVRGLGQAKASKVLACLELSSRYMLGARAVSVTRPEDLESKLSFLKYENQEHMVLVTLNSSNEVINVHELTTGLVNQTLVHPREVFVRAIEDRAVSVILVHNHPSGSSEPSREDLHLTKTLCSAGKIVQIPVIDHLIISRCGLTSLCRLYPEIFEKFL
ncbi:MAG: DNA repair protein RadC [Fibrobacter sp.]|nr:DNA repair protein RadC [Fibrobacter sp.]